MTDDEAIAAYVADMEFRALLPNTIAVRRRYLAKYSREVGFDTATEQRVIQWLGRPIGAKTRNMWLSTLNSFYVWALKNEIYPPTIDANGKEKPFNPVAGVAKPRMHPRNPRPIPADNLKLALANANPKMLAWLKLAALGGLRCQEIAGVCREDVYEETMRLSIEKGKGAKQRWVPLHPDILAALMALPMPASGPLWNETPASVSRKGNRFLHSLGVRETMHQLRHYFGTEIFRSSLDLRLTQELMGHSSPQTTAGYAAADISKASGVVDGLTI